MIDHEPLDRAAGKGREVRRIQASEMRPAGAPQDALEGKTAESVDRGSVAFWLRKTDAVAGGATRIFSLRTEPGFPPPHL